MIPGLRVKCFRVTGVVGEWGEQKVQTEVNMCGASNYFSFQIEWNLF